LKAEPAQDRRLVGRAALKSAKITMPSAIFAGRGPRGFVQSLGRKR
jgi:hypothetical protein